MASLSSVASHWPTDWILLGALSALVALDALRSGSARAATLALASPLALMVTDSISQAAIVGSVSRQFSTVAAQTLLFAAVFVVLLLLIHRIVFSFSDSTGPLQSLLSGVAAAAIVAVVWLQVPALQSLWHFGPQVQAVFGATYRFWWLAAAYIALAFVRS